MKFSVGDRVFANGKKTHGKYENTVNEIGTVKRTFNGKGNQYGVLFDNLTNIASEHGLYWFSEDEISEVKRMKKTNESKSTPTKIKVGDKVRIKKDLPIHKYVNGTYVNAPMYKHCGEEASVIKVKVPKEGNVALQLDIENCDVFWWDSEMVELITEAPTNNMFNIPSFKEIINKEINCIIHTPTKELAKVLFDNIKPYKHPEYDWINFWDVYKEDTYYAIQNKEVKGYADYSFYTTYTTEKDFKNIPIYEIEDIICASKSNTSNKHNVIKEEKRMNKTFEVIKGTRPNTNKGETGYIDTITTVVNTPCGRSTVTCDASDYDTYTGALVASAKIVAKSNSNASMMYNMAIELWGTDTSKSILHALANAAFKGYFDSNYKRWQKSVAYQERLKEKATRTCPICGKVFDTIAEMEAHVEKHKQAKARREAKKQERRERKDSSIIRMEQKDFCIYNYVAGFGRIIE